jgi:PEP-CTERM motif
MGECSTYQTPALVSRVILLCSLVALVFAIPAVADSTYTYTGPNFTLCDNLGSPCEVSNVSGSFTLASPLAANLSEDSITPESYSFANGLTIWNNTNSSIVEFALSTNGSGNIVPFWSVVLQQPGPGDPLTIATITGPLGGGDYTEGYLSVPSGCPDGGTDPCGIASGGAGTWTGGGGTTTGGGSVPEPSSMLLLGSGVATLGLLGALRKQALPKPQLVETVF